MADYAIKSLAGEIEQSLDIGRFISYNRSWQFIDGLESVRKKIAALVKTGKAVRAISLYEMFLSGCYEKINEVDDSSGNLGMFFEGLFCDWIIARQKVGISSAETVQHILNWIKNDKYGFCCNIEADVSKVLKKAEFQLFKKHFQDQFEKAFQPFCSKEPMYIFDYPFALQQHADTLKKIYIAKKDVKSYLALCEKILPAPKDYEEIAKLQQSKRRYKEALDLVEKGLALENKRDWRNHSSYGLSNLKQKLLNKLGRKNEALEMAWSRFKSHPSGYYYEDFMKYVEKKDRLSWHKKAISEAERGPLAEFIELCTKTKELDILAARTAEASHKQLEDISHYTMEPAAKALAGKHDLAAAKSYRALGMRILKSRKSKYYSFALDHLQIAKKLYEKNSAEKEWLYLVDQIRKNHSRKYSFIGDFEKLVAGKGSAKRETFHERAKQRWKKQVS